VTREELLMHQLQDTGGAHVTAGFCEHETGLALSFKMGFPDVTSGQKARSPPESPERAARSPSRWAAVTAPRTQGHGVSASCGSAPGTQA